MELGPGLAGEILVISLKSEQKQVDFRVAQMNKKHLQRQDGIVTGLRDTKS